MNISSTNRIRPDTERVNTDLWRDSEGKEVRNQIADAKNRLKELSADKGLSEEERKKKQQEIQQKIADLNKQLKLRQLELQRSYREQKGSTASHTDDSAAPENSSFQEEEAQPSGIPHTGAKAFIAAHSAVNNARSQGSLAATLKSRVRILQGEIRQDEEHGRDTRLKQEELKKLEDKAARLNGAGFGFLTDASRELRQAAEKNSRQGKKNGANHSDGFVRPLKSPLNLNSNRKTDIYLKGTMFSTVDFRF